MIDIDTYLTSRDDDDDVVVVVVNGGEGGETGVSGGAQKK